ncbi:hypothetical protein BDQ17DRAFT_1359178 [Cyathus striatus]|nr:hypothetical protein BDQ17DRAFT_1359178 [Cyathus striatus]
MGNDEQEAGNGDTRVKFQKEGRETVTRGQDLLARVWEKIDRRHFDVAVTLPGVA